MLDTKQFISAIKQIAEEKGIPEQGVISAIEDAIAAAYRRDTGRKGQIIRAHLNQETGDLSMEQIKIIVEGVDEEGYIIGELTEHHKAEDEKVKAIEAKNSKNDIILEPRQLPTEGSEVVGSKIKFNPEKYITLEDAEKEKSGVSIGDEIVAKLETRTEFGRIAAQAAKQVIIQRLREIEREIIFSEFKNKEGEVVSGVVQRLEGRMIYIDLGRTNGLLIPNEQIAHENYRINQRLRFVILRVEDSNKGPMIILSRSHPRLLNKLFEFEVPEIEAGSVEVKSVAREAGSRSKIAVTSNEDSIDPIGSLVGQKGVRVQTVINELGGEKIDIIEWSDDPKKFIAHALSPAKVLDVKILDEEKHHALVEVADDQFSLAIGKKGQNVRLAAKLTNWKIDVRAPQAKLSSEEAETEVEGNVVEESKETSIDTK